MDLNQVLCFLSPTVLSAPDMAELLSLLAVRLRSLRVRPRPFVVLRAVDRQASPRKSWLHVFRKNETTLLAAADFGNESRNECGIGRFSHSE